MDVFEMNVTGIGAPIVLFLTLVGFITIVNWTNKKLFHKKRKSMQNE